MGDLGNRRRPLDHRPGGSQNQGNGELRDTRRAARIDPAGRRQPDQGWQAWLYLARPRQPRRGRRRPDAQRAQIPARRPARLARRVYAGREISRRGEWTDERRILHRRRRAKSGQVRAGGRASLGRRDPAAMTEFALRDAALEIVDACYSYGKRAALTGVTFSVAPASFCVLLGLNGAGKSTLFALITRLFTTRPGRIRIFGHDVAREPGQALRRLGVVFQSRALDLDISVRENLLYHAALHGIAPRKADVAINKSLDRVALADRLRDRVGELSGGQMRRVEIARALLHEPKLLLLDEPTVGLDIRARAAILGTVRALTAQGVAALWATHLVDEVAESDQVVVLHRGAVLGLGQAARIVAETGASDIRGAFAKLVGDEESLEGAA